MRPLPLSAALLLGLALAAPASAQETRGLGAHQHGEGKLDIAFDGTAIAMELEAPGADIVGFEHAAGSDADRAALDEAKARLADPLSLFVLPEAAGCQLVEAQVAHFVDGGDHDDHAETPEHHEGEGEGEAHDHGEDAGHRDHGDTHDHAHGHGGDDAAHSAGHDDDHDGEDHDAHEPAEASHSEFRAAYLLRCADPARIDRIGFAYFDAFPGAETLEVQMVGAGGATAAEVSRAAPALTLPGIL
ncbi:DUF2796 domain-containing protein [Paralimibaculum aggregatum]|uniref:DUF2796 domain-containing protein n=1 Tax=Paralimibaculum aggregatum TaxID=3036245 RepID=A0ABQ6LMU0_9RHOB|nr:DUF2796 domain-containing protein [Limibaculum sp. NKW23]GMG82148.1 DUF2796 domain-containing protein [Limibaculum sp. NKW23]